MQESVDPYIGFSDMVWLFGFEWDREMQEFLADQGVFGSRVPGFGSSLWWRQSVVRPLFVERFKTDVTGDWPTWRPQVGRYPS